MWHAWHIYKIWWFKAICPTWCDWFPSCSVYPKITLYGEKRQKTKKQKPNKKKEKLHLDKTNCSVYVFNVLCSACFSMEWNIPNVDLFSKWISVTRPPTHAALHTHTGMCTVRWNTEEIKTVRVLVDGLMKDEGSFFFSSSHLTHQSTHHVSLFSFISHKHSLLQTLLNSSPSCVQ